MEQISIDVVEVEPQVAEVEPEPEKKKSLVVVPFFLRF